jgi:hypothetical protein
MDNTPLINTYKVLTYLFNTTHNNIAWVIRNGPKYPKDLNIVETF